MLIWDLTGAGQFRAVDEAEGKRLIASGRAQLVDEVRESGGKLRYAAAHPDVLAGRREPPEFDDEEGEPETPSRPPRGGARRGRYKTKVERAAT